MNRALAFSITLALAGCGGTPPVATKGGPATGFAIIGSDYKSTTLSLADPTTHALAQDDCLDSGSVTPTLSMAFSGDVVSASAKQPGGALVLVDRMNSALDYITPTSCTVAKQLSVSTGFYSNPHDVAGISTTKAYVTRFSANATPGKSADDGGNDVLIINPSTGAVSGRVDLAPYNSTIGGAAVLASPDRAILANGKVYVALGSVSADFMTTGTGLAVVIDPASDSVTGTIDLSMYKSCSGLDYNDATKTLLIGCGGDYNAMLADQTAGAAIVVVDVSGATPVVKSAITGSMLGARPVSASVFAFAGNDLALVDVPGDLSGTPADTLWAVTLSTGAATKILTADNSFLFGAVAWDSARKLAYVTDASAKTPLVHVLDVSAPTAIKQLDTFASNPKSGLPPRQIAWY